MVDTPENPEAEITTEDDDIVLGVGNDGAGADTTEPPMFERRDSSDANGLRRAIFNVPIEVVVSVGTARPLIGDLLSMGRNHLLPLDSAIDDPVELRVKDQVIARGELTQTPGTEGGLGVKLTEIVNIAELAE